VATLMAKTDGFRHISFHVHVFTYHLSNLHEDHVTPRISTPTIDLYRVFPGRKQGLFYCSAQSAPGGSWRLEIDTPLHQRLAAM